MGPIVSRLRFQPSRPAPSLPHQAPNERAENTGILRRRQRRASPLMMWTASPERHQVPRRDRCRSRIGKPVHENLIRIGIDLAKNFFQVHAIEREGEPAVTRKLSRGKVLAFFAQAAPCRVGMEACGSSHYWAREIRALGHDVVLIPPAYTKPYVKRGKNDANDAAAGICGAMVQAGHGGSCRSGERR